MVVDTKVVMSSVKLTAFLLPVLGTVRDLNTSSVLSDMSFFPLEQECIKTEERI